MNLSRDLGLSILADVPSSQSLILSLRPPWGMAAGGTSPDRRHRRSGVVTSVDVSHHVTGMKNGGHRFPDREPRSFSRTFSVVFSGRMEMIADSSLVFFGDWNSYYNSFFLTKRWSIPLTWICVPSSGCVLWPVFTEVAIQHIFSVYLGIHQTSRIRRRCKANKQIFTAQNQHAAATVSMPRSVLWHFITKKKQHTRNGSQTIPYSRVARLLRGLAVTHIALVTS